VGDPLIDVDETAPLRPESESAYCAAKAVSEQIVFEANTPDFETISIRPRFVWGPGSSVIGGLVGAAQAGQFAWIDGGQHMTDTTYVDNVVEGLLLGWKRGTPGEAYFITDQQPITLREFLEQQFEAYGVSGEIGEIDAATAELVIPVPARWFIGQACTLRTDKASKDLGYAAVVSRADGLSALRRSVEAAHSSAG
jgi:nucleoside-diphosphate-sugar epimerase